MATDDDDYHDDHDDYYDDHDDHDDDHHDDDQLRQRKGSIGSEGGDYRKPRQARQPQTQPSGECSRYAASAHLR